MITRILTIAQHEFVTLIRTKAFIAGILMLPLLMAVFVTFMNYAEHQIEIVDRTVAVIDETGVLFDPLDRAAQAHNLKSGTGDTRTGSHIRLVRAGATGPSIDDVAVALSAKVKAKELFGFVELPAALLDAGGKASIRLYAQTTSTNEVADWLETAVNDEIARRRCTQAGVDQALV